MNQVSHDLHRKYLNKNTQEAIKHFFNDIFGTTDFNYFKHMSQQIKE